VRFAPTQSSLGFRRERFVADSMTTRSNDFSKPDGGTSQMVHSCRSSIYSRQRIRIHFSPQWMHSGQLKPSNRSNEQVAARRSSDPHTLLTLLATNIPMASEPPKREQTFSRLPTTRTWMDAILNRLKTLIKLDSPLAIPGLIAERGDRLVALERLGHHAVVIERPHTARDRAPKLGESVGRWLGIPDHRAKTTPHPSDFVDFVIATRALEHVEDIDQRWREICRVPHQGTRLSSQLRKRHEPASGLGHAVYTFTQDSRPVPGARHTPPTDRQHQRPGDPLLDVQDANATLGAIRFRPRRGQTATLLPKRRMRPRFLTATTDCDMRDFSFHRRRGRA
jgi:hypothetical protein